MPFKISPEELNPHTAPSGLSLSLQRNERLVKNAQRQMEHDGRIKPPRDRPVNQKPAKRSLGSKDKERSEKKEDKTDIRKDRDGRGDTEQNERRRDENREKKERRGGEEKREGRRDEQKEESRRDGKKDGSRDGQREGNRDGKKEGRRDEKKVGGREEHRDIRKEQKTEVPKGEGKEGRKNSKKAENSKPNDSGVKPILSTDGLAVTRLDAVVFAVVLAQIVGCFAVGFEIYAYSLDQEWNGIINGKNPIQELGDHRVFKDKTFKLEGNVYLQKTLQYITRDEPEELVFIIIILIFVLISLIHIFTCYIKAIDVEQYAALLIGLYAFGGAICMFSSTFLITAAVNIENSFSYAADMLHNYRYINTDEPLSSTEQDKCHKELRNGCDYYEFAKLQAMYLERIFRQCGSGSRFTRYYHSDSSRTSVQIFDEIYFRSELKELGFCSRDGYKFAASACALIMGILFAIVPVIFCCEGRAATRKRDIYTETDTETVTEKRKSRETPVLTKGTGRKSDFDPTAVVEQFRVYVERDSENDGEQDTVVQKTQ